MHFAREKTIGSLNKKSSGLIKKSILNACLFPETLQNTGELGKGFWRGNCSNKYNISVHEGEKWIVKDSPKSIF